jgi:alpha-beta hydrolase superfamily lysophospholipase
MSAYISKMLFRPPKPLPTYNDLRAARESPAHVTDACHELYETTKIPSVCCKHSNPQMVIAYAHGNSENILTCAWFATELSRAFKADVYAFEYCGYFAHREDALPPAPSEAGCFDASAVFVGHLARRERETRGLPVVLVGYSLGCAVALHAADAHRRDDFPAAVLLMAPFVSAASVVLAPRSWMLSLTPLYNSLDMFCMRTAALRQGHCLFVAHGTADEVIPAAHGRAIAQWAAQHAPKDVAFLEVPDATHASLRLHSEIYETFLDFLNPRLRALHVQTKDVAALG